MSSTVEALASLPDDLAHHEPRLARIVPDGLALFLSRHGLQRGTMSVRTERSGINDCLVETAKKLFPGQYIEKNNLFLLCLGPYKIKLKKLSKKLRTSNNPTQLVLDFLSQKLNDFFSGDLFVTSPITSLHLGYIPDDVELLKSTSWITRPNVARLDWIYELRLDAAELAELLPTVTQPDDSSPKPTVTPKRSEIPETGAAEESR